MEKNESTSDDISSESVETKENVNNEERRKRMRQLRFNDVIVEGLSDSDEWVNPLSLDAPPVSDISDYTEGTETEEEDSQFEETIIVILKKSHAIVPQITSHPMILNILAPHTFSILPNAYYKVDLAFSVQYEPKNINKVLYIFEIAPVILLFQTKMAIPEQFKFSYNHMDNWFILLKNCSDKKITINRTEVIAQLIVRNIVNYSDVPFKLVPAELHSRDPASSSS